MLERAELSPFERAVERQSLMARGGSRTETEEIIRGTLLTRKQRRINICVGDSERWTALRMLSKTAVTNSVTSCWVSFWGG